VLRSVFLFSYRIQNANGVRGALHLTVCRDGVLYKNPNGLRSNVAPPTLRSNAIGCVATSLDLT
jgi:hypothetical protein